MYQTSCCFSNGKSLVLGSWPWKMTKKKCSSMELLERLLPKTTLFPHGNVCGKNKVKCHSKFWLRMPQTSYKRHFRKNWNLGNMYLIKYQIRVQHQIRVQADHFEIFNRNTVSNKNTGNQILKFSVIKHLLFDQKFQFRVKIILKIQYRWPHFKKLMKIQHQLSSYRRYFFQKMNKNTCTPIWYLRVKNLINYRQFYLKK